MTAKSIVGGTFALIVGLAAIFGLSFDLIYIEFGKITISEKAFDIVDFESAFFSDVFGGDWLCYILGISAVLQIIAGIAALGFGIWYFFDQKAESFAKTAVSLCLYVSAVFMLLEITGTALFNADFYGKYDASSTGYLSFIIVVVPGIVFLLSLSLMPDTPVFVPKEYAFPPVERREKERGAVLSGIALLIMGVAAVAVLAFQICAVSGGDTGFSVMFSFILNCYGENMDVFPLFAGIIYLLQFTVGLVVIFYAVYRILCAVKGIACKNKTDSFASITLFVLIVVYFVLAVVINMVYAEGRKPGIYVASILLAIAIADLIFFFMSKALRNVSRE